MSIVEQHSHRAILIPELVAEILDPLSASQATKTARVCKAWLELSLDLVWKGPVGMEALVKLLAPVARDLFDNWVSSLDNMCHASKYSITHILA